MKGLAFAVMLASLLGWATPASAETPEQSYAAARAALERGAYNEAIDRMELLADLGVANPDAGLLRAAAYLARADGNGAQIGDLGRAAAALSETLWLRPDDTQAERGLEAVQAEIARRRTKQQEGVVVRPRLSRAIASLLPEQLWATLALLSSLAVALGIVVRRFATQSLPRLTGMVAISVGSALGVAFGAGAYAAEQFRVTSQPAVVVVAEARLTNELGRALPSKRGADTTSVPEGATVYVRERRDERCLVEWGSTDGWLRLSEVRLIAAR